MSQTPFARLAVLAALAGAALAGCTTPSVKPKVSQAVLDARARRNAPTAATCPEATLSALSPVTVGFPFNEATMTDLEAQPLAEPARWLACHPAVAVVVKPDSDGHGAAAEQNALAQSRAARVRDYLTARGVGAERIRILVRGAAAPAGEHLLIQAEGRRW